MHVMRTVMTAVALFTALWLAAPPAAAQEEQGPAEGIQFQAVEGPQTEDVAGGSLMLGAYAVVLALLVLYVIRIAKMQSRMALDLDRLERSLADADASASGGGDSSEEDAAPPDDEDS